MFNISILFLDPVIKSQLTVESEKFLDHSVFDLLTMTLTENQKINLNSEILKTLESLIGADQKITESEISFFNKLTNDFGLSKQVKLISRSMTKKHLPDIKYFDHNPALKHLMIWLMFFLVKKSGTINHVEIVFIDECAEELKINLSNYLKIKSYFQGESSCSCG